MQFTIPANTSAERYGNTFGAFCDWLTVNGVDPALIDGTQLLTVTSAMISGTVRGFGNTFEIPVQRPMSGDLAADLERIFFTDTSTTDNESASLDDMAQWFNQLANARVAAAEAKRIADEARDQILGRLKQTGKEYGSLAGQRVIHAKTITKNYFNKAACAAENPEIVAKYTEERSETRLEIL